MPTFDSTRTTTTVSIALLAMALVVGCGGSASDRAPVSRNVPTPSATPEPEHRVVVLGDSLAAGLGLPVAESFPAVVETRLRDRGLDVEVVNAGVSGDTSAGGLGRLDWVLQRPADVLVVELGGNDALRGQPVDTTEANLREIVRRGRAAGARVVLLGMDVPTNYGPEYASSFAAIYPRVAADEDAILVPGFVHDLGSDPELLQPDGLHPTAEGQRRLAERLLPVLIELLENR